MAPTKKVLQLQQMGWLRRERGSLLLALAPAIVTFMIAGCSSAQAPSAPAVALGASAAARPEAAAGSSALKQINQGALQAMLDKTARELLIPGAVILLRTPQGEITVAYGTTQLGTIIPPRADTYFRIASNTKTMTAAVILQLAQEKKLRLQDSLSKYIPRVPNGENITIAELLEMRSGLYNYTNAPEVWTSMDHYPAKVWSPEKLLAIAFAHPPNFRPGTAYEYSNTNYVLLGMIIEKVGAKSLAQAMRERLFQPLHLQHTELPAAAVNTIPEPTHMATSMAARRSRWWGALLTHRKFGRPRERALSCPGTTRT